MYVPYIMYSLLSRPTNAEHKYILIIYFMYCKPLEFKAIKEENNNINYLDLFIHKHINHLCLGIYRKLTQTDTTIHVTCSHALERKLAAYIFHINRLIILPITEQAKQQD
jgi:hypothetical protein